MAATEPTSVILTTVQRDAIFKEIEFAFDCAGDLPFLLEHGAENGCDRDDARDLVTRLQVAIQLLDQLGWQPSGDRDSYVVDVDETVDWFATRMASYALAGLEHNRGGPVAGDDRTQAATRELIDADLEKLGAARVLARRSGSLVASTRR